MKTEGEKKYVCMRMIVREWESERTNEWKKKHKLKRKYGKNMKKNNKKKIINHSKTSFYWETDFNEEKNEREKN